MDKALPPLVLVVVSGAIAWAFSPSLAARPAVLWILAAAYAPLLALALYRMWRDGTLLDLFRFRSGDLTLGVGIAVLLGAACWLGRTVIAPRGSPADMLVMRVYLQLGEVPAERKAYALAALAVLFVACAEEIVWRGLVQQVLEERWGVRVGWLGTAALYALAHAPTVWLLGVPGGGKNPFVVMTALFCGVVWGFLVGRMQRLPPAILAHAALAFALVMQFRLWSPG
jgi:membrane protease YdiL (CAAX protease family)